MVDNNEPGTMEIGDCFTIEPSLVHGSNSRGFIWDDGWTMSTEVSRFGVSDTQSSLVVWSEERSVRAPGVDH